VRRRLAVLAALVMAVMGTLPSLAAEPSNELLVERLFAPLAEYYGLTPRQFVDTDRLADEQGEPLREIVMADKDGYGGSYFDWTTRQTVVLHVGPRPTLSLPRQTESPVRFEEVRHSLAELGYVRDEIAAVFKGLSQAEMAAIEGGSVGIHEPDNRVHLRLPSGSTLAKELMAQYGDIIHLQHHVVPAASTSCSKFTSCWNPFRGGIRITGVQNGYACSFGAYARRPNGNLVAVTAGHCDWA
jgi:hypothetical protein